MIPPQGKCRGYLLQASLRVVPLTQVSHLYNGATEPVDTWEPSNLYIPGIQSSFL